MANNISKMSDLMAVTGENAQVLGKFVYFSLSNILVYREDLQQICEAMGLENISAPAPPTPTPSAAPPATSRAGWWIRCRSTGSLAAITSGRVKSSAVNW